MLTPGMGTVLTASGTCQPSALNFDLHNEQRRCLSARSHGMLCMHTPACRGSQISALFTCPPEQFWIPLLILGACVLQHYGLVKQVQRLSEVLRAHTIRKELCGGALRGCQGGAEREDCNGRQASMMCAVCWKGWMQACKRACGECTLLSQGVGTSRPSHMRGSRSAQALPPSAPSTSSRTLWQNTMRR